MVELSNTGAYLVNGSELVFDTPENAARISGECAIGKEEAKKNTIAYGILESHNTSGNMDELKIKFDKLTSHDITFVGIIQTARASGLEKFPIPYVLTNCHNSLCAVGGTINEDDHLFGLSAAKKYGGVYVPPHQAVIHQYAREMLAECGKMILGSDSHTRYGAIGTMAMGEGGPELVKQLLSRTYDIKMPGVIAIYLTGAPQPGVGPQDIALAIIGEVFANGYVKNKVMEFVGPGVSNLSMDYRIGVDVMTTETACLSSIWRTDDKTKEFLAMHGRADAYKELNPGAVAYYDGVVSIDLSKVRPMIALPFHPSNTYTIEELNANLGDILRDCEIKSEAILGGSQINLVNKIKDGKLMVDQGIIAGCAGGGYENICDAADIMETGAIVKTAFCGPCFGAGDTPANDTLSIRHTTRNFPSREGSKPQNGQLASVALMDARSIAATAANKGVLTPATDLVDVQYTKPTYHFDSKIYENRIFDSHNVADPSVELRFGPNIKDWPEMVELPENLLIKVVSEIHDPVTTTDELIPSGETSSYRSNPLALAEFALSRKDPEYVARAKAVQTAEKARESGECVGTVFPEIKPIMHACKDKFGNSKHDTGMGSTIFAVKPGDGSAREQAASCQKVLGGWANIANDYATKRYRSNLINWGMIPFIIKEGDLPFENGDYIFIPGIREMIANGGEKITAYVVNKDMKEFELETGRLTEDERQIILDGCLINYYKNH